MLDDIAEHTDDDTDGSIRPQKALIDARSVMGAQDILLSDVGAHKMWIARHYHCYEPNTCLIPNGFCSMGFALPGAIAANLVFPEHRVLAVCGDAGFLMNVQEMETARRLGSEITVLVWEDNEYGLIAWKSGERVRSPHGPVVRQPRLVETRRCVRLERLLLPEQPGSQGSSWSNRFGIPDRAWW